MLPFVRPGVIKLDMRLRAPGALPTPLPEAGDPLPLRQDPPAAGAATPFEVVAAVRAPRRVHRELVAGMSVQLEHQALDAAEPLLRRLVPER